jgi:hypothetical protein
VPDRVRVGTGRGSFCDVFVRSGDTRGDDHSPMVESTRKRSIL